MITLLKLFLIVFGFYGFYEIGLQLNGWHNHGMGLDLEFIFIRGSFAILSIVAAIGLHLNKTWSQYIIYFIFSIFAILLTTLFINSISDNSYSTSAQLLKAVFIFSAALIFSIIAIYSSYVNFKK